MTSSRTSGFTQSLGNWIGTAEVYDGKGRFLGNATDRRHCTEVVGENRVRIELSFTGPLKFAGHYFIEDHKTHRLYQGPANIGYAETLASNLIDANAYWAVTGLTQRFFLMISPDGNSQISLGLLSRGEDLMYTIIGEYARIPDGQADAAPPALVNGTHYDLQDDPAAGRGEIYLHRPGSWAGDLQTLDGELNELPITHYKETITHENKHLAIAIENPAFNLQPATCTLATDGYRAWSTPGPSPTDTNPPPPGARFDGSYSLSGGRALSGHFHHLDQNLRVWRREVATHDGTQKAVLHTWYRGGQRVGVQFGMLRFER